MLSPVRLSSVVCLPVTFVRLAQAVQIFGNISTALRTLAKIGGKLLLITNRKSYIYELSIGTKIGDLE